jgi:hypothetical protein
MNDLVLFVICIVISLFIIRLLSRRRKTTNKEEFKQEIKNSTSYWLQQSIEIDVGVIDITPTVNKEIRYQEEQFSEIPYWDHHYIYSYKEINSASQKQKRFYFHFKNKFLNGEYIDLKGNTNYAFILLFDLLREYDKTGNIDELEKQLELLGLHYPKTKSYANSNLIQILKDVGNNEKAEELWEEEHDYWKLGSKYRAELKLTREYVKHLNSLYCNHTKFNNIDFCMKEIIKLYCSVISELKNKYMQENTTLDIQIGTVGELIAQKRYGIRKDEYWVKSVTMELYNFILKHCENAIREYYRYVPKLNIYLTNVNENPIAYDTDVISTAIELMPKFIHNISPINENQERILNDNYPNRWKKCVKELHKNYAKNKDCKQFFNEFINLCSLTNHVPESIFYDATKFMLKYDMETTIKLYLHYLNYGMVTEKKNYTELSHTHELSDKIIAVLKTDHIQTFKDIVTKLITNKDMDEALNSVPDIYRKRIQIDNDQIAKIQQQHAKSVALLNEYMNDESENENNVIESIDIPKYEGIHLSQIQAAILLIFENNNFSVPQYDIETFAKSKGILKNQIIESINDVCYEHLDDSLIEENEEYYIINPDYYKIIQAG